MLSLVFLFVNVFSTLYVLHTAWELHRRRVSRQIPQADTTKLLEANSSLEEENMKLKFQVLEAAEGHITEEMIAEYLKKRKSVTSIDWRGYDARREQALADMHKDVMEKLRDKNRGG
jgi:hypothetical protein